MAKTNPTPKDAVYTGEIEPLWNQIAATCKANNITAIAAFGVPLTQNAGAVMLHAVTDAAGRVPPAFGQAYALINQSGAEVPGAGTPPKQ